MMKNILDFLIEVGKLKGKKRRGWIQHKIKNPETTVEHIFHVALLVWIIGRKAKINLEKSIKMALIHDLCDVYVPDLTSYDALLFTNKRKPTLEEILKSRPKFKCPTIKQRRRLAEMKKELEMKAMKKLLAKFPPDFKEEKKEIKNLWMEYKYGLSREARIVTQAESLINFLQGIDYWKKYRKIPYRLWVRRAKEVLDDPTLLEFVKILEKRLCQKGKS